MIMYGVYTTLKKVSNKIKCCKTKTWCKLKNKCLTFWSSVFCSLNFGHKRRVYLYKNKVKVKVYVLYNACKCYAAVNLYETLLFFSVHFLVKINFGIIY